MHTKFWFVLALLAASTPGMAADFENPPVRQPLVAAAAAFSWTGFYIGGQVGGGWNRLSGMDPTMPIAGWSSMSGSGILAGGQLGFNYQIGSVVLGAEGSYAWSGFKVSDGGPFAGGAGLTVTDQNDYVATAAGRVGYAFDRVLVFGKGGGAWTRDKVSANDGLGGTGSGSFNRTGWVAGAGVEYAFLQNWSLKLEYDFMRFGPINELPTTTGGLGVTPAIVKLDIQTALLGLSFRF